MCNDRKYSEQLDNDRGRDSCKGWDSRTPEILNQETIDHYVAISGMSTDELLAISGIRANELLAHQKDMEASTKAGHITKLEYEVLRGRITAIDLWEIEILADDTHKYVPISSIYSYSHLTLRNTAIPEELAFAGLLPRESIFKVECNSTKINSNHAVFITIKISPNKIRDIIFTPAVNPKANSVVNLSKMLHHNSILTEKDILNISTD